MGFVVFAHRWLTTCCACIAEWFRITEHTALSSLITLRREFPEMEAYAGRLVGFR